MARTGRKNQLLRQAVSDGGAGAALTAATIEAQLPGVGEAAATAQLLSMGRAKEALRYITKSHSVLSGIPLGASASAAAAPDPGSSAGGLFSPLRRAIRAAVSQSNAAISMDG